MVNCSYEIDRRPAELGGGWSLKLYEDGQEVGGGVFPALTEAEEPEAYDEALIEGENWLNARDAQPQWYPVAGVSFEMWETRFFIRGADEVRLNVWRQSDSSDWAYDVLSQIHGEIADGEAPTMAEAQAAATRHARKVIQEQRDPTPDEATGMAWWNHITEEQRAHWLSVAGSARPADAWTAFKEGGRLITDHAKAEWEQKKPWTMF